jgi:hypothetical protein
MALTKEFWEVLGGVSAPWMFVILVGIILAKQAPQIIRELRRNSLRASTFRRSPKVRQTPYRKG